MATQDADTNVAATPIQVPAPAPVSEQRPQDRLQLAARLGGIFLVAAYACGFVVLAIYHAAFKISDFGLVQPRILAAGFLFLLFIAIPAFAVSRTFALFGLHRLTGVKLEISNETRTASEFMLGFEFYVICFGIAQICRGLLRTTPAPPHSWIIDALGFAGLAVQGAFVFSVKHDTIKEKPGRAVSLALLTSVLVCMWQYQAQERPLFWTTAWFYLCGLSFLYLQRSARDKKDRFGVEWERFFLGFLLVLIPLFSRLYGDVRREFGGGEPVQAVLFFSTPQLFTPAKCANILLIEETEAGYYALPLSGGDDAFFVRRDQVSAVRFSKNADKTCTDSHSAPFNPIATGQAWQ